MEDLHAQITLLRCDECSNLLLGCVLHQPCFIGATSMFLMFMFSNKFIVIIDNDYQHNLNR